jgi:hypothetical protein
MGEMEFGKWRIRNRKSERVGGVCDVCFLGEFGRNVMDEIMNWVVSL